MSKKNFKIYDGSTVLDNYKINNFFYKNENILNNLEKIIEPLPHFYENEYISYVSIPEELAIPFYIDPTVENKIKHLLMHINFLKIFFIRYILTNKKVFYNQNNIKSMNYSPNNSFSFFFKNHSNFFINPVYYTISIVNIFLKKNFFREFFKVKVQKKQHTFYKNVINVDIFNKKLNINFDFEKQLFIKKSLLSKLIFSFNHKLFETNKLVFTKNEAKYSYVFSLIQKPYRVIYFSKFFKKNFFLKKKKNILYEYFYFKNGLVVKKICENVNFLEANYVYNITKLLGKKNSSLMPGYSFNSLFPEFSNQKNLHKPHSYNYMPDKKTIYNNYLPYYNMFVKSKFFKNVMIRNNLSPTFVTYYNYYLLNFLEIFLKKKIWLKINSKSTSIINKNTREFIQTLYKNNKLDQISLGRHFYLLEFLEIMFIAFFYRDLKFFSYWVKKTMEKLHLKKHRKFLKVIHNTLKNNSEFLILLGVKGFNMDVRGKLGTTGNSKKKHYAFTVGTMSPTSKDHDMSLNQTIVRTSTGVLGVSMTLSF